MTPLRRVFVVALLTGVLGLQAYFAAPPNNGGWYWPFLDYPMYASARQAGEQIAFSRVQGVPCHGGRTVDVTASSLGVAFFLLEDLVTDVVEGPGSDADAARERLRRLVREEHAANLCAVKVYRRSVRLGERPAREALRAPWREVAVVSLR